MGPLVFLIMALSSQPFLFSQVLLKNFLVPLLLEASTEVLHGAWSSVDKNVITFKLLNILFYWTFLVPLWDSLNHP